MDTNHPTWQLSAEYAVRTGAQTELSLRWLPVFGAAGYRVLRSPSAHAPYQPLATVREPFYTDTGLTPDTVYRYQILPIREGDAPPTDPPSPEPLPAPADLRAAAAGPAAASLSWPLVPGAQGYVVYRGRSPSAPLPRVGAAIQNAYADAGLTSGLTYYYRVAAYDAGGIGALSPMAAVTTLAVPAPAHVTAAAAGPCEIQLRWSAVPGAAQYAVSRSEAPEGPFTPVGTALRSSFRDTALEPGTAYWYQVAAAMAGGAGAPSATVTAETWSVTPPAAAGLRARALSCCGIAVSWTPVPGADRYLLSRNVLPEGPFLRIADTTETFYPDAALLPNTTYYYRVAAVSAGVTGPDSPPISAATLSLCATPPPLR